MSEEATAGIFTSTAPLSELPALPQRGFGDGYDWMSELQKWAAIPGWGRDGWDMGSWPYVIILTCAVKIPVERQQPRTPEDVRCRYCGLGVRSDGEWWVGLSGDQSRECQAVPAPNLAAMHWPVMRERVYGVASYCEGDIERYAFARHEERIDALDALAQSSWRRESGMYAHGVVPIGPLPAKFFGAFSWERLDQDTEVCTMCEKRVPREPAIDRDHAPGCSRHPSAVHASRGVE